MGMSRSRGLGLVCVVLLAGPGMSAWAGDWVVAYKGLEKHRYREYSVTHAAAVMAEYMGKVLGVEVPTARWGEAEGKNVFLITETKHAPKVFGERLKGKRRDAFIIKYPVEVDGRKVCMLVARDNFAHDFAVYSFLTTFMDVHWVGPGELGEVIRPNPKWQMPSRVDLLENPDFESRFWHMLSFRGRQWLGRSMRMGHHHALGHVFDPKKHAKTHPEVYPMLADGTRFHPKSRAGWQPCVSQPISVKIATDYVLESLKKRPEMVSCSLSLNDGAGNICLCPGCRALDLPDAFQPGRRPNLSDRFYAFYNQVMENVLKVNPEAYIAVLRYGVARTPPRRVNIHPRIQVYHVQSNVAGLVEWAKAGAGINLHLWLYDGGYLIIRPDMKRIAEQIRIAKASGGAGVYSENIAHWPSCGPRFYVLAHLLWDVTRGVDELYDEYLNLAYGPHAAPHVRAYYRRWDEVFCRQPIEFQDYAMKTWRKAAQFDYLRRDDTEYMAAALKLAAASRMTDKQRQRFAFLDRYHAWLALNAEQVLLARELSDPKFVYARTFDQLAGLVEPSLTLTDRFNRIWREEILGDGTGWMMDAGRKSKRGRSAWDLYVGQLRMLVASRHDTAIDTAMTLMTRRTLAEHGKAASLAFWQKHTKARPKLVSYIGPQINRLKGVQARNVVPNGSFEKGTPGVPIPKVEGWLTYQDFGMMKATKNNYAWGPGTGRDGGHAFGLGDGQYAELRTGFPLEQGRRYRISFWYRTQNREEAGPRMFLFHLAGELDDLIHFDYGKQLSRFLQFDLDPTGGQWRRFTRTFIPERGGNYLMQPNAGRQKPGQWVWFDDIEINRLW